MRKLVDDETMLRVWNESSSAADAASKLGISSAQAIQVAFRLRRNGKPAKSYSGTPKFAKCKTCGSEFRIFPCDLKRGKKYCSVKCAPHDGMKTHGESRTRLHGIWLNMKTRCFCEKSPAFQYYGGRGISICEEWKNSFEAFRDWALSSGYRPELEIDRRDTNGNYEPGNCRWATRSEQMRNTRKYNRTKSVSGFKGVSKCNSKWRASISVDGKPKHLGVFSTELAAAEAYDSAARQFYGEFARVNFPWKECATS